MLYKKIFLLLLVLFSGTFTPIQAQESLPAKTESAPLPPSEPQSLLQEAQANTQAIHAKLADIQAEQENLKNRLETGNKEILTEADRAKTYLEIQDIAPEEFKPYLKKWQTITSSYHDVSEDVDNQIDAVNQTLTQVQNRLRLLKLREGDLKLEIGGHPKEHPTLHEALDLTRQAIRLYDNEQDFAEALLVDLGKNKTVLLHSYEICQQNYTALTARWEKIRFSRLTYRQQPKFSWENLNLAIREMKLRKSDLQTAWVALTDYAELLKDTWVQKPFFGACIFLLTALVLFLLRKLCNKVEKGMPSELSLLEKFSLHLFLNFTHHFISLGLVLLFGFELFFFKETRTPLGLFLFALLLAKYFAWVIIRMIWQLLNPIHAIFKISPKIAYRFRRRAVFLVSMTYLFIVLWAANRFLEFDSEAARLLKWALEILIFTGLIIISKPDWIIQFSSGNKWFKPLAHSLRPSLSIALILLLGLDIAGYTHLSDYLADGILKSLALLPCAFLLKKGLDEFVELHFFKVNQTRINVEEDLLEKLKYSFNEWSTLLFSIFFIFALSGIWDLTPEFLAFLKNVLGRGFAVGQINFNLGLLLSLIVVFYFCVSLSRLLRTLLERNIYPRKTWDQGIRNAISTGVHYLLMLFAILFSLRFLGFDIRNITVLAGALGVGLGFGLQNLANNFASGIVLLIERPIKVGDLIQFGDITGKVKKIGARSTVVETGDQASILIPNGELLSTKVTNWTYSNNHAGLSIPIRVPFGADLSKIEKILVEHAQNHPKILKHPVPHTSLNGFGDYFLNLELKIWVQEVSDRGGVQTDLLHKIEQSFRENEIQIPYPQQKVTLDTLK